MLVLLLLAALGTDEGLYGAPIEADTPTVTIEDLMASPEQWLGKVIKVEGTVHEVCPMKGCWVDISEGSHKVRIKVKDGEIVFDQSLKGKSVVAEGTVYKFDLTKEQAVSYFEHLAEEMGESFDPASVTEGTTIYQIGGLGLKVKP
jgi:hypothetical protein